LQDEQDEPEVQVLQLLGHDTTQAPLTHEEQVEGQATQAPFLSK